MSDIQNEATGVVSKNEELPIQDIINQMRGGNMGGDDSESTGGVPGLDSSTETTVLDSKENQKVESTNVETKNKNETNEKDEVELSPLEKMKLEKEKMSSGQVYTDQELKDGEDNGPQKNIVYNDSRMKNFQNAGLELIDMEKKRSSVALLRQPVTQQDYIEMMSEIESITFDENGKAVIHAIEMDGVTPREPKWIRPLEEGETPNDFKKLKAERNGNNEESDNEEEKELTEEAKNAIQIIIDKTGLGPDIHFTDEEKEKISLAETIKLNEVKIVDINTFKGKRISDKSFQEVIKEHDYSGSRVTVCFPGSGFKAQMKGLTYGEYADIALTYENLSFDSYYKKLSIIYNKMTNISRKPFENFEDFLKSFAYTDINLAVYALFVATEAEDQDISLRCGRNDCDKGFIWKFQPRNTLRLEKCSENVLFRMREIATADAADYDRLCEESAVKNSKVIELPGSKFMVEIGIVSAYDFLYNFIPIMDREKFEENFGENNTTYLQNSLLLTSIHAVYVPTESGIVECLGYKDILDAIYKVTPNDIKIVMAYAGDIQSKQQITFGLENVVCPHCQAITKFVDIDIDEVVFRAYQRLMSTEIELPNQQG